MIALIISGNRRDSGLLSLLDMCGDGGRIFGTSSQLVQGRNRQEEEHRQRDQKRTAFRD